MAYNVAYRKRDDGDDEPAPLAVEYAGYTSEDLTQTVTLLRKVGDPESQTLQYCIDNAFKEVEPGVWAGSWHIGHPKYDENRRIPEALKRFVREQALVSSQGSSNLSDCVSSENDGMIVCGVDEPISLAEALDALRQSKALLDNANSVDEPWQHPKELLDATAGALDEAALATRADRPTDMGAVAEIEQLCREVKKGRKMMLDAAARGIANSSLVVPIEKKEEPLVVWATQTGTSRKFALELKKSLGEGIEAVNMKNLSLGDMVMRRRVFFVSSTFGLGRPPRDAERFYATLQLQITPGNEGRPLKGVGVAVAALGNSKFGDFAAFGKALSQELQTLGAVPLLPVFPVDAISGRSEQKAEFRKWQDEVLALEGKAPIGDEGKRLSTTQPGNACCVIL